MNERYNRGIQPCKAFKTREISPFHGGPIGHYCPICVGLRWFCDNCHTDHHQGGWESCKAKPPENEDEPDNEFVRDGGQFGMGA